MPVFPAELKSAIISPITTAIQKNSCKLEVGKAVSRTRTELTYHMFPCSVACLSEINRPHSARRHDDSDAILRSKRHCCDRPSRKPPMDKNFCSCARRSKNGLVGQRTQAFDPRHFEGKQLRSKYRIINNLGLKNTITTNILMLGH